MADIQLSLRTICWSVFVAALVIPARADPVSVATLLRQGSDFGKLSAARNWRMHLDSSHDRTGGNKDDQNFLSMDGATATLADLKGPGAVVRIWSTAVAETDGHLSSEPTGQLKIYLDDQPVPVIDLPFVDLFKKGQDPFVPPLTRAASAAYLCYLPIPYAKHCRITVDNPRSLFYQINSLSFPAGTKVRSFALPLTAEDQGALSQATKAWSNPGGMTEYGASTCETVSAQLALEAGGSAGPAELKGSGVVRSVQLNIPDIDDVQLRRLILRAWFDGHQVPDLEAPVADFFGNAYGRAAFDTIFLSQNDHGEMSCRLPMPFAKKARFSIENGNKTPVTVNIVLAIQRGKVDTARNFYLHADFNQELTVKGKPHLWAHVAGQAGHLAGVVQTMQSGRTLGYCEGDSQYRVDEERFDTGKVDTTVIGPANGTGTEDDFNDAWYFSDAAHVRPLNACLVRQDMGRINAFRFFLNDAPVWKESIDAQLEHGGLNDTSGEYYSSVTFWYGKGERQPLAPMPAASTLGFPGVKLEVQGRVLEGESLVGDAKAGGGTVRIQTMDGLQHAWSEKQQLLWREAKIGDKLDLSFPVPEPGEYQLDWCVTKGPDYGCFSLAIDGSSLEGGFDACDDRTVNIGPFSLGGKVSLKVGTSHLVVTLIGKNQKSTGTSFGLDALVLRRLPKDK